MTGIIFKKLNLVLFTVIVGLFALPISLYAHPGRTDRYGCHTCKTNCPRWGLSYGEYVCHRSKGRPQPKPSTKNKRLYYYEKDIDNSFSFIFSKFRSF